MEINLIAAPYDSGLRNFRMGRGPEHLIAAGLPQQLGELGFGVHTTVVETAGDDVTAAFDLANQIALHTRAAVERAAFPIILAGNCISSLGGLAGLRMRTGLLWLDAHADCNTPETSPSGFLDGMALAVITGRCHRDRADGVAGFEPLPDERVAMLGVRAVDEAEQQVLRHLGVVRSARELGQALARIDVPELYLHIDLDALDPSVLKANGFATPYGLSLHTLHDAIATARATKHIAALALTAYDPAADVEQRGPAIALDIIKRIVSSQA